MSKKKTLITENLPAIRSLLAESANWNREELTDFLESLSLKSVEKLVESASQLWNSPAFEEPGGDAIGRIFEKYLAPGRARVPVLLQGPPGISKTYRCERYGREEGFDKFIFIPGNRGMESFDLLGQFILMNGSTKWKDGPLSEAFRSVGCARVEEIPGAVERGRTALVLVDEIYRIPRREREIFLTALQAEEINGVRVYKLRTGNAVESENGTSGEEILYAPVHLLSVVATTNVGVEFDVEEECAAGLERWLVRFVEFDQEGFRAIVRVALEEQGFCPQLSWKFVELYRAMENAKNDGNLRCGLSLRTAVRGVENAGSEEAIGSTLLEVLGHCVDSMPDGRPNPEQREVLRTVVRAAGFAVPSPPEGPPPSESTEEMKLDLPPEASRS